MNYLLLDEKRLIALATEGDQMAYRALYQIYEKPVRSRLGGYFKWKADLDDVVSETFQKAFLKLSTFDTERDFKPWLLTIATRTALDRIADIRREDAKKEGILTIATESESGGELSTETSPEEDVIKDEIHTRLMGYIDVLPPLYKDVMVKYMIEELEYEQIARDLELELNTVRTRIRRGKALLAEMMLNGEN